MALLGLGTRVGQRHGCLRVDGVPNVQNEGRGDGGFTSASSHLLGEEHRQPSIIDGKSTSVVAICLWSLAMCVYFTSSFDSFQLLFPF